MNANSPTDLLHRGRALASLAAYRESISNLYGRG